MTYTKMVVVLLGLGAFGCGGRERTPPEKCDDLIDLVCDRTVECVADAAGQHDECVQAFEDIVPCVEVEQVALSYDDCMDELDARSCQSLFPTDSTGEQEVVLPTDCEDVLLPEEPRDPAATLVSVPLAETLRALVSARRQ